MATRSNTTASSSRADRMTPPDLASIIDEMTADHAFSFNPSDSDMEIPSFSYQPISSAASKTVALNPLEATRTSTLSHSTIPPPTTTHNVTATLQSYTPPPNTGPWYDQRWTGSVAWILIMYSIFSFVILGLLRFCGVLNWRGDLDFSKLPPRDSDRIRPRRRAANAEAASNRVSVASADTELGDPDEVRDLEVMRRQWEARGIHVTVEQLREQLEAYDELQAQEAERQRRGEIVMQNMRTHGML
ncbi:hypothetical protein PRZ48_010288 [Zasmidium cellare]|uniref:Uncharacterized protein n=1 Tax=Zasmidium cellare TaxID=395010 RepID=A0ABR0E8S3_ZASCE|nr:hypothetical protein PRZ48_010288 [Zasmidium cellare]